MKTLRITILAAALAATVYSCSTEREDEVNPAAPAAAKVDLKPLKKENNNQGTTSKTGDSAVIFQPTKADTMPGSGLDPIDPTSPTDPNEGGDPKNLPPRN